MVTEQISALFPDRTVEEYNWHEAQTSSLYPDNDSKGSKESKYSATSSQAKVIDALTKEN